MKILTGTISHETSTFTPVPTTMQSFSERFGELQPDQIIPKFRGVNVPTGGFIEAAEAHGFELVPTIFAEAHPSGPVPRRDLDRLLDRMLGLMQAASPADGVLLELHGSMAAEGIDDGEAYILAAVRDLVGPEVPIVGQLDIHSNVSHRMVELADVLIGRETYPEVDMAARGRECADVMVRIVRDGLRPTMALSQIPMFWGLNQVTAHPPMSEAIERLHRLEAEPGVVAASIATCFPLADAPHVGASVHVVTDNDPASAQRHADELAAWIYRRRADWHQHLPSTREALAKAEMLGRYPAVFADKNDNTGGGSPGDSTGMLRTFLDSGLKDACILYIVDHESALACHRAGVGATVSLQVGGKSTPSQGPTVSVEAVVEAVSDGAFRLQRSHVRRSPWKYGSLGPDPSRRRPRPAGQCPGAALRHRLFADFGAKDDPRQMRYIGLKSAAHFRAGFEAWAGQIQVVSEPGAAQSGCHQIRAAGPPRLSACGGVRKETRRGDP